MANKKQWKYTIRIREATRERNFFQNASNDVYAITRLLDKLLYKDKLKIKSVLIVEKEDI